MPKLAAIIAFILRFGSHILNALAAKKERDFRNSLHDDPCGVLIRQLGGKNDDAATAHTDKPQTGDSGRDTGRVDG